MAAKKKAIKKKAAKKKAAKKKAAKKKATGKKAGTREAAQTPADRLEELLAKRDGEEELLEFLLGLDEAKRRELSPRCQEAHRQMRKAFRNTHENPVNSASVEVAAFCTGNLTEIKKLSWWLPKNQLIGFSIG